MPAIYLETTIEPGCDGRDRLVSVPDTAVFEIDATRPPFYYNETVHRGEHGVCFLLHHHHMYAHTRRRYYLKAVNQPSATEWQGETVTPLPQVIEAQEIDEPAACPHGISTSSWCGACEHADMMRAWYGEE